MCKLFFRKGHKAHFDFLDELKTWTQSDHRSKHYLQREKENFFVQVNKLINLCITYMHRKEVEGILFSPE